MLSFFHGAFRRASDRNFRRRGASGFTLVDILAAVVVIGIGVGASVSFMARSNGLAEVNRNINNSEVLCQERIAQVVASPFSPPGTIPTYFGNTWPVLATDTATSTETVQLCTDVSGGQVISATRTTLVSLADASLNLVRVTARVSYTYRGRNYAFEAYTLRAPD